MQKYELLPAEQGKLMLVHHGYPQFIITFERGKFNSTQQVKEIDSFSEAFATDFMGAPRLMRQAGDWLAENHKEVL